MTENLNISLVFLYTAFKTNAIKSLALNGMDNREWMTVGLDVCQV